MTLDDLMTAVSADSLELLAEHLSTKGELSVAVHVFEDRHLGLRWRQDPSEELDLDFEFPATLEEVYEYLEGQKVSILAEWEFCAADAGRRKAIEVSQADRRRIGADRRRAEAAAEADRRKAAFYRHKAEVDLGKEIEAEASDRRKAEADRGRGTEIAQANPGKTEIAQPKTEADWQKETDTELIVCPNCGLKYRVRKAQSGSVIGCGGCGTPISGLTSGGKLSSLLTPQTPNPPRHTDWELADQIGRQFHKQLATAWSSWDQGDEPYGRAIETAAQNWAEAQAYSGFGSPPRPDRSELETWQRNRDNSIKVAWVLIPAAVIGLGYILQSPFVFVALGLVVAWVVIQHNQRKPEIPPARRDPARDAFISGLTARATQAALRADQEWRGPGGRMPWSHGSRPAPVHEITFTQAESLAAAWMRYLGADGVVVTPSTRDGGIDVVANHFVAQVKHQASPVSPAAVQQLAGIAHIEGKRAVFFALSGYSRAARDFANRTGMALYRYSPSTATLVAESEAAELTNEGGLSNLLV
jgi:hypothetical protein